MNMAKEPILRHGSFYMLNCLKMQHDGVDMTAATPLPPAPRNTSPHASTGQWVAAQMGIDNPFQMHLKPADVKAFVEARGDAEAIRKIAQERHILVMNPDLVAWVEDFVKVELAYKQFKDKGKYQLSQRIAGGESVAKTAAHHPTVAAQPAPATSQQHAVPFLSLGVVEPHPDPALGAQLVDSGQQSLPCTLRPCVSLTLRESRHGGQEREGGGCTARSRPWPGSRRQRDWPRW